MKVDVIGHLAIGPDLDADLAAGFGGPVAIEGVVVVAEEDPLAPVASLSHVMRDAWKDNSRDTGHASGGISQPGVFAKTGVSP